ncbi:pyridoxine 5'-phosphate synthase [Coralloluteibacterium thermophilus]|uniref:Pyridoxine 5'-phosphate synthase n=1 Tax=Coralloluteibacterium thermophilum TaxID=2707049 RepID=A0ABV9NPT5_9GAMM
MTRLSVNLNKIAVLRNSRGGDEPSVLRAADAVIGAGCAGITVHPRPDRRHVREDDVRALAALTRERGVELNIEGNPFAPPRGAYPGLLALCAEARPQQVTLVPDADGQLTSDHGFDMARDAARLRPLVSEFAALGCRVSLFMDAGSDGVDDVAAIGAHRIEIYTGPFADAHARGDATRALALCRATALRAQAVGLQVNAGHDLSLTNLAALLQAVPDVAEVSIGHALVGEALYLGLDTTVRRYLELIDGVRGPG